MRYIIHCIPFNVKIYLLLKRLTCQGYSLQEQSKSDAEKLIADMTNLVSNHIRRQKELVRTCFVCFYLLLELIWFQYTLMVEMTGGCKTC